MVAMNGVQGQIVMPPVCSMRLQRSASQQACRHEECTCLLLHQDSQEDAFKFRDNSQPCCQCPALTWMAVIFRMMVSM